MARNRTDEALYNTIAEPLSDSGITASEVKRAVLSFFSVISQEADSLPFDDERKIYKKDKFDELVNVHNIPYVGRIGPVYSRYLKWRANEAKEQPSGKRSDYRIGLTRGEIEDIAEEILSGGTPQIKRRKNSELFNRVWLVGKDGKKSARQVIPKETEE